MARDSVGEHTIAGWLTFVVSLAAIGRFRWTLLRHEAENIPTLVARGSTWHAQFGAGGTARPRGNRADASAVREPAVDSGRGLRYPVHDRPAWKGDRRRRAGRRHRRHDVRRDSRSESQVLPRRTAAKLAFISAYYLRQRPGVGIHSPLHCCAGTGWDILSNETIHVDLPDGTSGSESAGLIAQKRRRACWSLLVPIHGRMIGERSASRLATPERRVRRGRNDRRAACGFGRAGRDFEGCRTRRGGVSFGALVPISETGGPS